MRPATDPACHCLPPPRLHTLVTSPPRSWMAQPLVTQALFAPATALPAPRRTSCLQPLPVHTASPAARTSLGSRTGPSSMLSRLSLLPWQVRVGDPQAASAAVSDAVRSDAVACCDAPPPLPAALTLPAARPPAGAVARARRPPSPIGLLGLLSDPSTPPPRGFLAYCTAWLYYILCA